MKFACLGYFDEKRWLALSESDREAMIEKCFAYDAELKRKGHWVSGEALQSARDAVTLRWQDGKVSVTDGPYAETKEQLGGLLVIEAKDRDHAVRLMSKHPGIPLGGPFEIRPLDEEFTARANARIGAQQEV